MFPLYEGDVDSYNKTTWADGPLFDYRWEAKSVYYYYYYYFLIANSDELEREICLKLETKKKTISEKI